MDPESASGVVARLKSDKVPYTLDEGGRTIRVPVARLDELRLAGRGSGSAGVGTHRLRDLRPDVVRRDRLPRARELPAGARRRAGAHDRHDCGSRRARACTSRWRGPRCLPLRIRRRPRRSCSSCAATSRSPPTTTAAISGLIAAGVEGLRPEAVVIIDNFGRPLTHSTDGRDEATGAFQVERQQRIERDLSARVVSLLEPIVGPAHVRVNISAKLNTDSQEETVERFDPTPVVRSHESVVQGGTAAGAAQGAGGRSRRTCRRRRPTPRRRRPLLPLSRGACAAGAGPGDPHAGADQLRSRKGHDPSHSAARSDRQAVGRRAARRRSHRRAAGQGQAAVGRRRSRRSTTSSPRRSASTRSAAIG